MPRKETSLDGDCWELGQVMHWQGIDDVERWLPTSVPGNVRGALLAAGMIEDPYVAKQNELSRWVEDWNWYYKRAFEADARARRTFLRFEGIDYHCHIFMNGRRVAENVGMFAPVIVEVSKLVKEKNTVSVNVEYASQYKKREDTLKCQMGFGWDFAPEMRTMGIWDSVSLIQTGDVFIRRLSVQPVKVTDDYWEARVTLEFDALSETEATLEFDVEPEKYKNELRKHTERVTVPRGVSEYVSNLPMKEPRTWQPWEEGARNMHRLCVRLKKGRSVIDNTTTRFGVREIELQPNEGRSGGQWTFVVNGKRKFIRGANWVPADSLPGEVGEKRYRELLEMARAANINTLRVWGGGLREKKAFYDICDELGIMVWQEFPLACPTSRSYSNGAGFRKLVSKEVRGILDVLHNHPSVAFYCGGNEFSYARNRRIVNRMRKLVCRRGGGRSFSVSSPTRGENHNWQVFHLLANVADYRKEKCEFLSEFGLQSVPVRESLYKFIPSGNQWPVAPKLPFSLNELSMKHPDILEKIGRLLPASRERRNAGVWTYHNAQLYKLFRYAREIGFEELTSFISATQRMQAHGLQIAIEHARRRRYKCSGVMFWQFNEPWPCVSWSVVDYYLQPKLAYDKIKQVYSPLLASLEYDLGPYKKDQQLTARAFVINDLHKKAANLDIEVKVVDEDGVELDKCTRSLDCAPPDSCTELDPVTLTLRGDSGWRVECKITRNEKTLCVNEYDLGIVDAKPSIDAMTTVDWFMRNILWK